MCKSWLLILVGLLIGTFASRSSAGQETLDSLISLALKNNPDIAAAGFMKESVADESEAAGTLPDPLLTAGVMNLPANSFSLDQTPMSGVSIGLTQKLPWPGKLSAQGKLADIRYQKSQVELESVQNRIVRNVTDAYVNYSYWTRSRAIIENYLELLRATRDIVEIRYANGRASAQDLLRVGSIISRTEIRLLKTDQENYSSLLKLRRAVGDSSLSADLPVHLAEPGKGNFRIEAIATNPLVLNAGLMVDGAHAQKRLAKSEYWPDFSFGIDYRIRQDIPGDPVHGADFLTFRVGLDLPLWFFARQKKQVRAARSFALASQAQERSVRDMLINHFEDGQSKKQLALESLNRYDRTIIPEARAALEAAEVAYEVGDVDFNALLAAQSDLYEIRLERLDHLRRYHHARAALVEISGESHER